VILLAKCISKHKVILERSSRRRRKQSKNDELGTDSQEQVKMNQVILDIPGETLLALKVSVAEIGETLRMVAAVKFFELGRLSSGAAARLAGVPRVVFLSRLADYGVDTFRLTEEQLLKETRLA
jgi:predicted HTH domain antitoxin